MPPAKDEHRAGEPAPAAGNYVLVNIFGTPTEQSVAMQAGEPLPGTPDHHHWVLQKPPPLC